MDLIIKEEILKALPKKKDFLLDIYSVEVDFYNQAINEVTNAIERLFNNKEKEN